MKNYLKKTVSAVLAVAVLLCALGLCNPAVLTAYAGGDDGLEHHESGIFDYGLDTENGNIAYICGVNDFSVTHIDFPKTIDGYTVAGINGGYTDYLLSKCTGLKSVSIPDTYTSIGYAAFDECAGLTSITIPESVTRIGGYAFSGCKGLTSIKIPAKVTTISGNAFSHCTGLTSINIPDGITEIAYYLFNGCTGLTNMTLPSSVTTIKGYAFDGCTGLKSITIPAGVTSIDEAAFYGCKSLTDIYYAGTSEQKAKIEVASHNDPLANATWHYNSSNSGNDSGTGLDLSSIISLMASLLGGVSGGDSGFDLSSLTSILSALLGGGTGSLDLSSIMSLMSSLLGGVSGGESGFDLSSLTSILSALMGSSNGGDSSALMSIATAFVSVLTGLLKAFIQTA